MLDFYAGSIALERIRDGGLQPETVEVVAGAAGGPKWLILGRLDRWLFSRWFRDRKTPLHLVGSSSGAWRFAAVAQADPLSAIDRFEDAYIRQRYKSKPPPAEVSLQGRRILDRLMGGKGEEEILSHPFLRLHAMAVRSRNRMTASESRYIQGAGMSAAFLGNALHRRILGLFFDRVVFHDPRGTLPISGRDGLPTCRVPLSWKNLKPALLASGSIPLVMSGVPSIPDAPSGMYRDGGVTDYHMDLPFSPQKGIILFPHYTNRIIPGWLDKQLRRRRPAHLDHTVMTSPSQAFLDRLPHGKIPDRSDFWTFFGRDKERIAYWRHAADMGERLAEAFAEAVASGRIRDRVRPYGAG